MLPCGIMDRKRLANLLLTAALVFVFGWFGIDKLRNPLFWSTYLPLWMDGAFGVESDVWIILIGIVEMLFALLLLIPIRRVRQGTLILILLHFSGIVWQAGWNDVGVRDIWLMMSAIALLVLV